MKKSMILSAVLVVVLIASLAVATFAWFFGNQVVTVNPVKVTAATVDALEISKVGGTNSSDWSFNISLGESVGTYMPATYVGIVTDDTADTWAFTNTLTKDVTDLAVSDVLKFFRQSALNDLISLDEVYAKGNDSNYLAASDSVYYDDFYLRTTVEAQDASVYLAKNSAVWASASDKNLLGAIRVGIFEMDGVDSIELVTIWAPNGDTNAQKQTVITTGKFNATAGDTLDSAILLADDFTDKEVRHYIACVWIEGTDEEAITVNGGLEFFVELGFSLKADSGISKTVPIYDIQFFQTTQTEISGLTLTNFDVDDFTSSSITRVLEGIKADGYKFEFFYDADASVKVENLYDVSDKIDTGVLEIYVKATKVFTLSFKYTSGSEDTLQTLPDAQVLGVTATDVNAVADILDNLGLTGTTIKYYATADNSGIEYTTAETLAAAIASVQAGGTITVYVDIQNS